MALTKTQISELYVSIFNRASEKSGSQNWLNSGYNTDATTMANAMLATDAAKTYFGTSLDSNAAFVEHIYANTLNKGGADVDAAGKAGWVEFLETGKSRGEMVAKMIEAIKEYQVGGSKYATANQATKDAAQQFANRVEVSDYTADTLATIAVSDINSTLSFSSALTVTANPATVETAKKSVQALTIDGTTFSLTTGTDSFVGTAKNDLFKSAAGTLQTADTILDSSTTDSDIMNTEVSVNNLAPRIQNVETINVNGTYVTTGMDLANVSGTKDLNLTTGILGGTATVTNASSLNALKINAGTNVTTLNVTATASGTRDTVYVNSGSATATNITGSTGADKFDVTTTGNVTIGTTTAIDTVTLNLSDAETTVAGSLGNVVINQTGVAGTITVGAALTGNVASTAKTTITGDKDVTIKSTVANVTDTLIVDSSTGKSTLVITDTATSLDAADIQVDVVSLSAATVTGTTTINANSKLSLDAAVAAAQTIQVASTTAGTALTAGQGTLLLDVNKTQTAAIITDTAVGTVILNAGTKAANGNATVTMADLQLGLNTNTLVIQGANDLTLTKLTLDNTTADVVSAATMTGKLTVTDTVGTGNATLSLGSNDDSITSAAAAKLTIHANGGNDKVSIANALAVSIVNGGDGDDTITGNALGAELNGDAGNDTITGGAAVDTINGGAGDDVIDGKGGNDKITLGAGSDTVIIDDAASNVDVISDFVVGTDKLVLTGTSTGTALNLKAITPATNTYTLGTTHVVTLTGVTATDLSNSVQLGKQAVGTTAAVTYTAAAGATITSGAFNDHITQGAGTLTLDAGAGDDIIISGTNNAATLTGGAGSDTFIVTNTAASTISDFGATDILQMGAAANSLTVTVIEDFVATAVSTNASTATANTTLNLKDGVDIDMTLATMTAATVGYTIKTDGAVTQGATIVGSRAADVITGSKFADTITGGEGADTITAGAGADTIILTESVSAADTVVFSAVADSAASVAANTTVTFDKIVGFNAAIDKISIIGANFVATGNAAVVNATMNIGGATVVNDFAGLVTAAGSLTASATTDVQIFILDLTTNTGALGTGKYLVVNDSNAGLQATDLMVEITGYTGVIDATDFTVA